VNINHFMEGLVVISYSVPCYVFLIIFPLTHTETHVSVIKYSLHYNQEIQSVGVRLICYSVC
jgi:hypothetical protein